MNNELIPDKSYWSRNRKWIVPVFLFLILSIGILSSISDGPATDLVQAYADNSLYENAIAKAKTNQRVLEVIGEIEPIDKLAILEGNAVYSNDNNSVALSVRIKGINGNGKLDITAEKFGTEWKYKKIIVRNKNSKEEIVVVNEL